ncbi:hypothetical protein Q5Y75_06205 [Ruegeria sp. 2205SS24-7]|uniref:hypothetical protein n=1 Tax=Ruegeria discodermiae TaxID=3064389 RepID=UPI002741A60E|nr:hypothetical protein [Ruegeria sp. 2205SS24-7]MDP5216805.1 hypothetical protein [Ruegeria sp. 2205SS24-7]
MSEEPSLVFRESQFRLNLRRGLRILDGTFLLVVGIWLLAHSLLVDPNAFLFVGGIVALAWAVGEYLSARKFTDVKAAVGVSGIDVRTGTGKPFHLKWEKVEAVQVFEGRFGRSFKNTIIYKKNGKLRRSAVPLKSMPSDISEQFIATLRHYWPDLDRPWREQIKAGNGLDSGAG